jgi:hypothetical protein
MTKQTPNIHIDPPTAYNLAISEAVKQTNGNVSFHEAYVGVISSWANQYNMVFYQGKNGIFTRVHP